MICDPCKDATDKQVFLGLAPIHDPDICRDAAIQPHGCACAHGWHHGPTPPIPERELIRINSALPVTNGRPPA